MTSSGHRKLPPVRPEFEVEVPTESRAAAEDISRRLPLFERLLDIDAVRRALIVLALALVWEGYARLADNPLMIPTMTETLLALWQGLWGELPERVLSSLRVLSMGYVLGLLIAACFTMFAASSRFGSDLLSTLTSMFNPLPAIALLPIALLWFGLGVPSLLFVIVHSVVWAVSLNAYTGFRSVSETQRMAGRNYGLRGIRFVVLLLIPAAFASILAGLKIGWAFAWRTLIAAELVFGASSRSGGLGWYIFENRNRLETANVFAGLITIMIIGLVVEGAIFRVLELRTVRKWGMST